MTRTQRTYISKFSVHPKQDEHDLSLAQLRRSLELADLQVWTDFYIELRDEPDAEQYSRLAAVIGDDGIISRVLINEPIDPRTMIQVAHRLGVVDNESGSIVEMCALLGISALAGKVATTYCSSDPRLREIVISRCFNRSVEDLHESEPEYVTLLPLGFYEPANRVDLLALPHDQLAKLGRADGRNLSLSQMQQIRGIQQATRGASVSDVLLESMDARWSDHSMHTTWRSLGFLLDKLIAASRATHNPNIVSMFEDNAGVWSFYGEAALAIKAETHNGPSAVSAYFGQLTKLGGVLRDILGTGLGADPIGSFEYTATGLPGSQAPISGRPSARVIALETIRAIKEYGNTFGVPMMWSRMAFHSSYRAKPFALGGSIGLARLSQANRRKPQPGDMVMLIGGLTGNEGIHGASASSAGATMDEAAVQIGAPLEQVKFRKAIIDLRDADCIRALTDVGGAGLNSAVGEIGESCGVWVNTALVPLKTSALPMWRVLLSESQERMILAIEPRHLAAARRILERHQVKATVIGRFMSTRHFCVFHSPGLDEPAVVSAPTDEMPRDVGDLGFDLPYSLLNYEPPQRTIGPPPSLPQDKVPWPRLDSEGIAKLLEDIAGDPDVASQQYADSQYDTTVQGNTRYGPHFGHDKRVPTCYWAATPVAGLPAAVVFAATFEPYLYEAHPVRALRQMFCALLGRLVLAGVRLSDICVCDNFYTPHLSEGADAWLAAMVDELAALIGHFGVPVISGKDSSAGSTRTDEGLVHVPPAVFLSGLGKVPDVGSLLGEQWVDPRSVLVRIGPETASTAATVAGRHLGLRGTAVDPVDLGAYSAFLSELAQSRNLFRSARWIGPGGPAASVLTGGLAAGMGVDLDPAHNCGDLFAEHRCAAIVEMAPEDIPLLPALLEPRIVGRLRPARGILLRGRDLLTSRVEQRWTGSFEESIL